MLLVSVLVTAGGCQSLDTSPVVAVAAPVVAGTRPAVRGIEYATSDGRRLGALAYHAATPPTDAVVYLHGIESHAGWFHTPARLLSDAGFDVYCVDRRGSGINRENRGFVSGHADSAEQLIRDVDAFVVALRARYDRVWLVGLSWGGKLATAYALAHPEHVDGLVLITPGLRSLVDVSLPAKLLIMAWTVTNPHGQIKTLIEPEMFTTTPHYLAFIRNDPWRLDAVSARFLAQGVRLDRFIDERIADNGVPGLVVLAGQDRIVDNAGVRALLGRSLAAMEFVDYDDQTHSVQFDAPRRLVADIGRWIASRQVFDEGTGRTQQEGE